eukprot:XP_001705865.1 Hypothetical protein GL50803_20134 [Giardia lamblia ATCC 50803]
MLVLGLLFAGVVKRILLDGPYVILLVCLQQPCSRRVERVVWIGVIEKAANGKKYLGDGEHWGPLFLENVQADDAVLGNVRVEDLRLKGHFGWLKRVIRGEAYIQIENTRLIGRILRP